MGTDDEFGIALATGDYDKLGAEPVVPLERIPFFMSDTIYGPAVLESDSDPNATDENELATTDQTTDAAVGSTGPPAEHLIKVAEVMGILGIDKKTVRKVADSGELKCIRLGLRQDRYFDREDVLAFRDGHRYGIRRPPQPLSPELRAAVELRALTPEQANLLAALKSAETAQKLVENSQNESKSAEMASNLLETVQKLATYAQKLEEQLKKVDIRVHALENELQRRPNVTQLVEWKPNHRRVSEGGKRVKEQRKGVRF